MAGCLTRRFTSPSCSFFMRDHASILDMRVTSYPFTSNNWSPAFKAPVFSAAPPAFNHVYTSDGKSEGEWDGGTRKGYYCATHTGKYLFDQQRSVSEGTISASFETESQTSSILVNCYDRRWTPRGVLGDVVRLESLEREEKSYRLLRIKTLARSRL